MNCRRQEARWTMTCPRCGAVLTKRRPEDQWEYWHSLPAMKARDERHDTALDALGYRVVRLPGKTIKQDALRSVQGALTSPYFCQT